jgi:HEAT repeat protein
MAEIDRFRQALNHMDPEVRWVAVTNLEGVGGPEATELLISALQDNDNLSIRWRAAVALGGRHDPRVVEALVQALHDPSKHVRKEAASSLGRIGDPRAVEPLIERLKDGDAAVRIDAFRSLVEIGEPGKADLTGASIKSDEALRGTLLEIIREIDERQQRRKASGTR